MVINNNNKKQIVIVFENEGEGLDEPIIVNTEEFVLIKDEVDLLYIPMDQSQSRIKKYTGFKQSKLQQIADHRIGLQKK